MVIWAIPGFLASGLPIETTSLIILGDLIALVFFALLLGIAIRMRRQPDIHSRLLLLASILIASPALGRISLNATGSPILGLLVHTSLPLFLVGHDLVMSRRVHRATWWGTAAVVGSLILAIGLANTGIGQTVVRRLQ